MHTRTEGVYAAGDCAEIPHGVTKVPIQGLSGSHAYAQEGGRHERRRRGPVYQPVDVPWGMVAGKWMIGGVSFGETGERPEVPVHHGRGRGDLPSALLPRDEEDPVKLLADPGSHRLLGAQMVGGEGIKERADFLAMAVRTGITIEDLATMENVYSPPIGALNEPISLAAQNALAVLKG